MLPVYRLAALGTFLTVLEDNPSEIVSAAIGMLSSLSKGGMKFREIPTPIPMVIASEHKQTTKVERTKYFFIFL